MKEIYQLKETSELKNSEGKNVNPLIIKLDLSGMPCEKVKERVYSAIKEMNYFGRFYSPLNRENDLILNGRLRSN